MSRASGEAFTAAELAAMKLPCLAASKRGVLDRAIREGWKKRQREDRGGGFEFVLADLPEIIREAIKERRIEEARLLLVPPVTAEEVAFVTKNRPGNQGRGEIVPLRAADETPLALQKLTDAQRAAMEARLVLLREIDVLVATKTDLKTAIALLIQSAADGTLRPELLRLVPIANARAGGGGRVLSRPTIFRWWALREGGSAALAPRERAKEPEPSWAPYFLALSRRPQKAKLPSIYARLKISLPLDITLPSIHQVRRYAASLSAIERNKGRLGPKEMKALKPYVKRTTDLQGPLSVVTADGHTADFKVEHPDSGAPLRPEITSVLDTKTRRVIGWSASLKENSLTVLDALRNAIERAGVPAIFYTDNGPGYCNELLDAPAIGMFARLGIEHTTSIPYNSQARGKIERLHQSLWIAAARELPSYVGRDMDREAGKAIEKRITADLKERGASRLLMPWRDFIAWGEAAIAAYNAREHTELPRIIVNGRRRYMSPDEAWALCEKNGWRPRCLDALDAQLLWHPEVERKCLRGLVRLWNGEYFSRELEHFHEQTLRVGYDIHDASRVWVSDGDGRFICIAVLDGHARPEFPPERIASAESKAEKIHRERIQRRIGLKERQIEDIRSEGKLPAPLTPTTEITPAQEREAQRQLAAMANDQGPNAPTEVEMDIALIAKARADWSSLEAWEQKNFAEFAKDPTWRLRHELTSQDIAKISQGEVTL